MIKYFAKVFIIFFIILSVLFLTEVNFYHLYTVSFYPIDILLLTGLFFISYGVLYFGIKKLVGVLKDDVLLSNHDFEAEKEPLDMIQTDEINKLVLSRNQFDESAILIVQAMSAITSGLMNEARRHLVKLRRIIGNDAIVDILMLKIYKGEKNFDKMEELSQKLMQNENIQLVGMKAALEAQMEKKEFTEALKTVNKAFEVRQDLYWAVGSAYLLRAKNNDWLGALEVLDAGIEKNIMPIQKANRLKAVALYELAKQDQKDKTKFFKFIVQALKEDSRLIPAALDLADFYVKDDKQIRKAESVLCSIWSENPSYEVAMAYLDLFPRDTKTEKIQRMEKLALSNTKLPSLNNLILAELYINARKYAKARTECHLFLLKNPATQKIAEMLDKLESNTHKNIKQSKGIVHSIKSHLNFGTHNDNINDYPKDFQWVCANCGYSADTWSPICPQCNEIGRLYWHLYVDKESVPTE